ncbi:MAG: hypothetical protein KAI47_10350 [Deltaproteobacteria bacterium]|nr:hypothetical protein [Deltaproteobacteria bacterium]
MTSRLRKQRTPGHAALLVTAATLLLGACPASPPRFVPKKAGALPDDPQALVALVDAIEAQKAPHLDALAHAREALKKALPKHPKPFAVHWRWARTTFLMTGVLQNKTQCVEIAQEGMVQAKEAIKLDPKRVEGHYYLALNMARVAQTQSKLTYIKPMLAAAKRAQKIDPNFDHAGPLAFLGKVYLTAPAWPMSVGNSEKAVALLEEAVRKADRPLLHLFLGQAYLAEDEPEKAKMQLEIALKGDLSPRWRREAQEALAEAKDD